MTRAILRLLPALAVVAFVAIAVTSPARAASFKLVVNASNPVESLSIDQVEKLFLKKTTRWDTGGEVQPVDLADGSSVRATFSEEILGKDVPAVKSYWQRMIFSGRATPPPELSSDAEVLDFVRSNRGAVGYVGSGTAVGAGVKTVDLAR
jgi:ABC-type phosphate transport system substrate-binding protein